MTMLCVVQQVMIHRECLFSSLLSSGRQASCLDAPCLSAKVAGWRLRVHGQCPVLQKSAVANVICHVKMMHARRWAEEYCFMVARGMWRNAVHDTVGKSQGACTPTHLWWAACIQPCSRMCFADGCLHRLYPRLCQKISNTLCGASLDFWQQ